MADVEASELHLNFPGRGTPRDPLDPDHRSRDRDGTLHVQGFGPQSLEILGYTPEELLAEPTWFMRRTRHDDDRARVAAVSEGREAQRRVERLVPSDRP